MPGSRPTVLLALDDLHFPDRHDVLQFLEPGEKCPANPVLSPRPGQWDGTRCKVYGTVLFDPADRLFKMWYSGGADHPDAVRRQEGSPRHIGYAFSNDGINWERPDLGIIEYNGSTRNNLIHLDAQAPNVFLQRDEADPQKRFLLITESGLDTSKVKLLHSPDGVRWRRCEKNAITGEQDWRKRAHEPFSILYDPLDPDPSRRWKGYSLLHLFENGYRGRAVGLFTASDPESWVEWPTQPIMSAIDGMESEIHIPHVTRFHDTYVMLYDAMEPNHHAQAELALSDDGIKFRRVQNGVKLIPNGPPGQPDAGKVCVSPRSLFTHDGKIWWYYTISTDTYQTGPRGFRGSPWYRYVALANWREDGFASLRPISKDGRATVSTCNLRAMADGTAHIWINADAPSSCGGITVELLDAEGDVRGTSRRWIGDEVRAPIRWNEREPVVRAGEQVSLRLRFGGPATRLFAVGMDRVERVPAAERSSAMAPPAAKRSAGPAQFAWSFQASAKISSSPVLHNNRLFVTSWDQNLYALDPTTGKLSWKHATGNIISTSPAPHRDTVYTGSRDGNIYAVDINSGELRWKTPASSGRSPGSINGAWIDCSPAIAPFLPRWGSETEPPHRLFVGTHNRDMNALDLESGTRQWSFPTFNWILSRPAISEYTVYFGSMDGYVYAVDARVGALQWRYRVGRHLRYATSVLPGSVVCEAVCGAPLVKDGTVYIGADDGFLYALDAGSGEERWVYQTSKWIWGQPAMIEGVLVVASADGCVYGLDASSGKLRWRVRTTTANYADVVVRSGSALVACTDGRLYAIDPIRGAVAWTFDAGAGLRAAPAVADSGLIYLTTCGGSVHALRVR